VDWQSFTRGMSQIWLWVREERVDNFQNPTMFWQPLGTYCLNMATFEEEKKILKMWPLGRIFLKRILCILLCIGFFCQNIKIYKYFTPKKIYYSVIVGKYIVGQIFNTTNLILL
jgi:hypothetical protein